MVAELIERLEDQRVRKLYLELEGFGLKWTTRGMRLENRGAGEPKRPNIKEDKPEK